MNRSVAAGLMLMVVGAARAEWKKAPGPHQVEAIKLEWKDAKRDRAVPVKIYLPKSGGPAPVVLFSHGLGGTRDTYEYLGSHWASHGYASVHIQHLGSDESVWRGKPPGQVMAELKKAVADPRNALNRPLDVRFVLDELTRLNREESPLKGRLDLARAGIAGHSFGAFTTMAAAGQVFSGAAGRSISQSEPRLKAAIPISPNAPRPREKADLEKAFGSITIPTLHLTGTKDDSPVDPTTKPADRRIPFDYAVKSERYLVIFDGADHMVFGTKPRSKADEKIQEWVRMGTTAFWDAYLKEDAQAKSWLSTELGKELAAAGTFEKKPGKQK